MKLETTQSVISDQATANDIHNAVKNLTLPGDYIILSSNDQNYVQTVGNTESFILEYRKGSDSEHYQCKSDVSRAELESVLLSYLSGETAWKSQFQWKKIEPKPWWKFW